jgi:hypothetical protein
MIVYANKNGVDVIAIAGYAASAGDWACIEKMWTQTLNLYGVHELHTRSVRREEEFPYPDWPEQKRREFLEALIQIIREHTSFGVASVLSVQDYERYAPDWFQWENEHPYYFAFQLFFDMFLGTVEKLVDPPLPPGEKLTFVLDQNEFMQRSAGTFLQLKALRDTHDRMGTITFKSRKDCPLLQIADLIACLMQDAVSRRAPNQPEREWAQEMRQRYNLIIGTYNRENIPGLVHRIMAAKLKAASASFGQAMRVVV